MDMKASATNFRTVVTIWTEPMFFTPDMLMKAGTHRPTSTSRIVSSLLWPLLMNTSTYRTQPTAIPALPAHALIQYDHALKKPSRLPNATRAYAYGPPSAGNRRDSAANIRASAMAPTAVRPLETRVVGPTAARGGGRLKTPTPMRLPMISESATGGPKPPPGAAPALLSSGCGPSPSGWGCTTAGVSVMACLSGAYGTTTASRHGGSSVV